MDCLAAFVADAGGLKDILHCAVDSTRVVDDDVGVLSVHLLSMLCNPHIECHPQTLLRLLRQKEDNEGRHCRDTGEKKTTAMIAGVILIDEKTDDKKKTQEENIMN